MIPKKKKKSSDSLKFINTGAAATVDQCGSTILKGSAKERCAEYEAFQSDANRTCENPVLSADFQSVNYEVSNLKFFLKNKVFYLLRFAPALGTHIGYVEIIISGLKN